MTNRTEWNIMDIGILQTGAQNVPVYPTISEDDYEYILNHSGAIYCFVSDAEILRKINLVRHKLPLLKEIYSFDSLPGCRNWTEILDLGQDDSNQPYVETRKDAIVTTDL